MKFSILILLTVSAVAAREPWVVPDSICRAAALASPPLTAQVWREAAALLRSDRTVAGLAVLDSLRLSSPVLPDSFEHDFARVSAFCLLPMRDDNGSPVDHTLPSALSLDNVSWGTPVSTHWRAVSRPQSTVPPSFVFAAEYDIPHMPRLSARLVEPPRAPRLVLPLHRDTRRTLGTPLWHTPNQPPVRVAVTVAVDLSPNRFVPKGEYLTRVVGDTFDAVRLREDLQAGGAMSVQCTRYARFRGESDEHQTFVVFDLPLGNRRRAGGEQAPGAPHSARYVVAIRAQDSVREEAEMVLRQVLARFTVL